MERNTALNECLRHFISFRAHMTSRMIFNSLLLACTMIVVFRMLLSNSYTVLHPFLALHSGQQQDFASPQSNLTTNGTSDPTNTVGDHTYSKYDRTCGFRGDEVAARLCDVRNETLGFQKIFMISLPERTDKQDAFAVQASLSGIQYTKSEGVYGTEISSKSLPYTYQQDLPNTGSWRAHLNVIQHIVERRISSALIFEDDADWDVTLKTQLVQFARGSRFILNTTDQADEHSPYGNGWDLLWPGHCCARLKASNAQRFLIPDDPTVLAPGKHGMCEQMDDDHDDYRENSTRVVFSMAGGYCSTAYALTLRGAEKVLYRMSMSPFNFFFDNGLGDMCNEEPPFVCIASHPTLIGISVPPGPDSRASDILAGNEVVHEEVRTERVMFSVRNNIDRLFADSEVFRSRDPEGTGPEVHLAEIEAAVGYAGRVVGGRWVAERREAGTW